MNRLARRVVGKLRRVLLGEPKIPSYEEKRALIAQHLQDAGAATLVETGTYLGDTTAYFADRCQRVYSIELSQDLAERAKSRFEGQANVNIIHGDSADVLPELLTKLDSVTLFWLDGHYSGVCGTADDPIVTAMGKKSTPVVEELQVILNADLPHWVLVDDARLFVGGDYPTVREVKKLVRNSRRSYHVEVANDIIRIIPVAAGTPVGS